MVSSALRAVRSARRVSSSFASRSSTCADDSSVGGSPRSAGAHGVRSFLNSGSSLVGCHQGGQSLQKFGGGRTLLVQVGVQEAQDTGRAARMHAILCPSRRP